MESGEHHSSVTLQLVIFCHQLFASGILCIKLRAAQAYHQFGDTICLARSGSTLQNNVLTLPPQVDIEIVPRFFLVTGCSVTAIIGVRRQFYKLVG